MRAFVTPLIIGAWLAGAGCKPAAPPPQPTANPTPDRDLKAAADRQREAILKTAEALRNEQQGKAQQSPTPAAQP